MFIEILKKSLDLMKKNLNLTQLIFIFFIVMTIISPVLAGLKINIKALPFMILLFCVVCMFFSGLFFAFKKAMEYEKNPPKNDNPFDLSPMYFAEFFQGVGLYFKKFIFAGIFVLIIFILISIGFDYFVSHYVVLPEKFKIFMASDFMTNNDTMNNFINSLTQGDKVKLGKLILAVFGGMSIFGLSTMIYPVSLVNEETNFFKSFLISIKYLLKNLPIALITFVFFNTCLLFSSLLNAGVSNNIIVSIIAILLQCYLNVWYILTLFVYYEKVK